METEALLLATAIFVMRVINYAVGTIRLVVITRNQRVLAAILASLEALIFAVVIANVVSDLENIVNLAAYCLGAAVGSYVGMVLEGRLIKGYMIANVFLRENGHELALALREAGYGVTEMLGEGRDGAVVTLRSVFNKREMTKFNKIVHQHNPNAFVAVEEVRGVRHGWLGTGRGGKMP